MARNTRTPFARVWRFDRYGLYYKQRNLEPAKKSWSPENGLRLRGTKGFVIVMGRYREFYWMDWKFKIADL